MNTQNMFLKGTFLTKRVATDEALKIFDVTVLHFD